MPTLRADAPLEGIEALFIAQPHQAFGLLPWGDVAAHRGGIGAQRSRRTPEQLDDRFALELAAQVPKGGVEPCERAAAVAAGKLVLALFDAFDERIDLQGAGPERPGRDLTVKDRGRDVRVIGRGLTPALSAAVGGDAHEADIAVGEGLELADLHGAHVLARSG